LEIILRHPTFGRRRSVVPHSLGVSVSPCETTTLFPQVFKMSLTSWRMITFPKSGGKSKEFSVK
jgi:hypothetical protein